MVVENVCSVNVAPTVNVIPFPKVLVADGLLRLSNGRTYYKPVLERLHWHCDQASYNPGASLFDLVDIACRICNKVGAATLCLISIGSGLENVNAEVWKTTHRQRYWEKLLLLKDLADGKHCTNVTIVFGGHGQWNGYRPLQFQPIMEDVLLMADHLGIRTAKGIESFLSRDCHNPIIDRHYDRLNYFEGKYRDNAIDWLEDVLAYAADFGMPLGLPESPRSAPTPGPDTIDDFKCHPEKLAMLRSWKAIQEAINNQTVSGLLQPWIDGAAAVCESNGIRPTVFILVSGVNGSDGMGSEVSRQACQHFADMGFGPAPIVGLNLAESPQLANILQPWVISTNKAHLSWFLCFVPQILDRTTDFRWHDSFFIAENSCRLLDIVTKEHLQALPTNQWLVYRTISRRKRKYQVIDEYDRLTQSEIEFKAGVGSKLFKVTRWVLIRLWRLMVQSDPKNFLDWHTSALVANGIITRSSSHGYSCGHFSFQKNGELLPDEYANDLVKEGDLFR